ncbi:MAG: hypothetical protein HY648_13035 [Acidobacteria bacterium]|nr:hypothetical protein [Acidobacteriota bacterium]
MPLRQRDKKALAVAAAAVALFLLFQFVVFPLWDGWQQARANLPMQERTLLKYRQAVEGIGVRGAETASLEFRLREEEAGLLSSDSAALASAELQDLVKQLTEAQSLPVVSSNFLPTRPLGAGYAQVPLGVQFQCHLDQLVNLLQALAQSPKNLRVLRLQIQAVDIGEKLLQVNLTVGGVMRATAASADQPERGAGG